MNTNEIAEKSVADSQIKQLAFACAVEMEMPFNHPTIRKSEIILGYLNQCTTQLQKENEALNELLDGNTIAGLRVTIARLEAEKATARPNNPPKTAPAGPPKAEIPNETKQSSGSNTSTASVSDHSLPSAEELNTYRVRFGKLVDALSTAGLKSSKGLPLQKKVLAYLLQEGKKEAAEKISKADWELFFSNVGAVSNGEGGISKLVELVNSAVGGTN